MTCLIIKVEVFNGYLLLHLSSTTPAVADLGVFLGRPTLTVNTRTNIGRCEVESSVFTPPGDVSPAAEYDAGKLLDLHVDLKQLPLKYNCLLKREPSSNPSS